MSTFPNPPVIEGSAPTDGQLVQYVAATNSWQAVSAASVGALTVPQAPPSATTAPAAETAVAVPTTASTSTTPFGYAQAQADDIVTNLNAAVADIAALVTKVGTLVTEANGLRTALITAGVLS